MRKTLSSQVDNKLDENQIVIWCATSVILIAIAYIIIIQHIVALFMGSGTVLQHPMRGRGNYSLTGSSAHSYYRDTFYDCYPMRGLGNYSLTSAYVHSYHRDTFYDYDTLMIARLS